jgi:hypothetical protein
MSKVFVVRLKRVTEVDVLIEADSLRQLKRDLKTGLDESDVLDMNVVEEEFVDFITHDYEFDREIRDSSGSYWDFSLADRTEIVNY